VAGAIALLVIGVVWPKSAGPINTAVLTATFVAIFWYAIETQRLVKGQERAAEIGRHPWLEATNLKPELIPPAHGEASFGGYHMWLPITNVGHTPAMDVEIETMTTITDPSLDRALEASKKRVGQTLVPRDVLHQEISRALLEGPQTTIEVKARVAYRTIDGGRGRLDVGFRYTAEKGWRNLPTRYEAWLSDGTHLQ
jgi:hypothetical protein